MKSLTAFAMTAGSASAKMSTPSLAGKLYLCLRSRDSIFLKASGGSSNTGVELVGVRIFRRLFVVNIPSRFDSMRDGVTDFVNATMPRCTTQLRTTCAGVLSSFFARSITASSWMALFLVSSQTSLEMVDIGLTSVDCKCCYQEDCMPQQRCPGARISISPEMSSVIEDYGSPSFDTTLPAPSGQSKGAVRLGSPQA